MITAKNFYTRIPDHFNLPRRIARLGEFAYNLWWTWNPDAQRLFTHIDSTLWERVNHNPLRFLDDVARPVINAAVLDADYLEIYDNVFYEYDTYLTRADTWFRKTYSNKCGQTIAYFSMEFGLHEILPIYSGGLGVLAGDHLKEASDLGLPMVGIGLLYSEGYFSQRISEDGWQDAVNTPLNFDELPILLVSCGDGKPLTVEVRIIDRAVIAQIWEVRIGRIPLYLLDSNLDVNDPIDRKLTTRLYWSDPSLRIMQEILLGIGGVRVLRALNYQPTVFHMNEGHSAFQILERMREFVQDKTLSFEEAVAQTKRSNVFTTHTPVPAGNNEYPLWLTDKYLSSLWEDLHLTRDQFINLAINQRPWGKTFNMPILALRLSEGRNAVSEQHGRVARRMWKFLWPEVPEDYVPISHVTNGVHTASWMSCRLRMLYDNYLCEDWLDRLDDPETWGKIDRIPAEELWEVRLHLKRKLILYIQDRARQRWMKGGCHPIQAIASGAMLDPSLLTIGFARRFATYKRANLIFSDPDRLLELITRPTCPVQIIFAGKAHPADDPGKQLIQEVYQMVKKAENGGRLVFLEDYDMNLARYLVQGVDVWLNNPRRPNEASGTSGMKAALNGALHFSVLDGWWREAYNGSNGWAIGPDADLDAQVQDEEDAASLYKTLEEEIMPLFYHEHGSEDVPCKWVKRIKESLRTITPQFSARHMLKEYVERFYLPDNEYEKKGFTIPQKGDANEKDAAHEI